MTTNRLNQIIDGAEYQQFARESHETWRKTKEEQGWTLGPRDNVKKTNPIMMPFDQLPADVKGQNSLTPYAVANFLRTQVAPEGLAQAVDAIAKGTDSTLLDRVGEYVHSHFVAAMLAKGETIATRDDMVVYEQLTPNQKSWDLESAKKVAAFYQKML